MSGNGEYNVRLKRIDVFRLLAIYIVVWAHCQFFDGITPQTTVAKGLELSVVILMRSTMQFFFIASGYFVGGKILENPTQKFSIAWNYTKKLLLIFLFWCVIYGIENPQYFIKLATRFPIQLLFEGTRIHLWFLVALMLVVWLFTLWPLEKKGKSFLIFGFLIFALGLLGGSYSITPIGLNLHFNTRNGIFFSTLFFGMGVQIYRLKPKVNPLLAWGLYLGGMLLFAFETYFIWANWLSLPIRHDYLVGSIAYGLGIFLIAYSARSETRLDLILAPYNKYVLGIYVIHMLFIDLWKPLGTVLNPIIWGFLFPVLVFGSSFGAVILLSKTPLRKVVI
jgi:hypothetical protein